MSDDIHSIPPAPPEQPPVLSPDELMRQRWNRSVGKCVGIEVAVAIVVCALVPMLTINATDVDNTWISPESWMLLLAQFFVAAIWLGMGRAMLGIRLLPAASQFVLLTVFVHGHVDFSRFRSELVLFAIVVAVLGAVLKHFGLHVALEVGDGQYFTPVKGNLRQFTLAQLFVWTTFAAVLAALFKSHLLQFPQIEGGGKNSLFLLCCITSAFFSAIAARILLGELRGAEMAVLLFGSILYIVTFGGLHPIMWMPFLVMLVLLPFRIRGLCLRWTPSYIALMDS